MYKFIKTKDPENEFDVTEVEFTVDTETWCDLLEEFDLFLKGCGFHTKGTLQYVEEE